MAGVTLSQAIRILYRETDSCLSSTITLDDEDCWTTVEDDDEEMADFLTILDDRPLGGRPTAALSSWTVAVGATLLVCLWRDVRALLVNEE